MSSSNSFMEWFEKFNFFLGSETFSFISILFILYIAGLWLSLIIWVTRDVMYRSHNIAFQVFAILLNIFLPILGLLIYLILRPEKTLLEVYHEELTYRVRELESHLLLMEKKLLQRGNIKKTGKK